MPAETVKPKIDSVSRRSAKSSSAAAIKPLVTLLYEGTTELRIRIPPQKPGKSADVSQEPKEVVELTLPAAGKGADENDYVAALVSSLTAALLKDIALAKQQTRKQAQAVGISRAKARGRQFGRRSLDLDAELFEELCEAYADNEISAEYAGTQLGCSYRTFLRRYEARYSPKPDVKRISEQGV